MSAVDESVPDTGPKMDTSNVPSILQVGEIETFTQMDVSSMVTDPIVNNQTSCRFVLQNQGYLHDGSRITLCLKGNASTTAGLVFPLQVGVHSLIRRATLRIGGNTVSEIDDYNFFKAFQSMFLSSEINNDRESVMSARAMNHDFQYKDTLGAQSNSLAEDYDLSVGGQEYDGGGALPPQWLDVNNQPVFSITLGELFPFLTGQTLPLFAMKEEVIIDLLWEPVGGTGRACVNSNASSGTVLDMDLTQTKLVADYISYDGAVMTQRLNQINTTGATFNYMDYRLTKTSLSVADAQNSVRNLGGAGRIIPRIMTGINDDNRDDRFMLNKYSAIAPDRDYSSGTKSNGTLTTNIRMNDFFVFPIDLSNSAVLFDKTVRAFGSFPFVTREEYSGEGNVLSSRTFNGVAQNGSTGLLGNFFYQCYKLPAGRVNARGLELTTQCNSLPALATGNTYTQRTYIEVKKVAQLKNGFMTIGFQ